MEKTELSRFSFKLISFPTLLFYQNKLPMVLRSIFFESSIKITFSPIFIEQTEFVVPKSIPKHLEVKDFYLVLQYLLSSFRF